jgi:hypothetical protein
MQPVYFGELYEYLSPLSEDNILVDIYTCNQADAFASVGSKIQYHRIA